MCMYRLHFPSFFQVSIKRVFIQMISIWSNLNLCLGTLETVQFIKIDVVKMSS